MVHVSSLLLQLSQISKVNKIAHKSNRICGVNFAIAVCVAVQHRLCTDHNILETSSDCFAIAVNHVCGLVILQTDCDRFLRPGGFAYLNCQEENFTISCGLHGVSPVDFPLREVLCERAISIVQQLALFDVLQRYAVCRRNCHCETGKAGTAGNHNRYSNRFSVQRSDGASGDNQRGILIGRISNTAARADALLEIVTKRIRIGILVALCTTGASVQRIALVNTGRSNHRFHVIMTERCHFACLILAASSTCTSFDAVFCARRFVCQRPFAKVVHMRRFLHFNGSHRETIFAVGIVAHQFDHNCIAGNFNGLTGKRFTGVSADQISASVIDINIVTLFFDGCQLTEGDI